LFNTQGLECLKGKEFKLPVSFDPTNRKALISTQGGVFRINLNTNKCSPIVFADSAGELIKSFDFQCSQPFRDSWFSISSYEEKQGIFMPDKNTDTVREVIRIPDIPIGAFSTGTDFYHLIFLRGNEANGNLTYTFLDNKWKRTPHPMDSLEWTCVFFNRDDKTFWVAAERSLLHFNIDFNLLKSYKRENGLPDLDIISIIADNRDNIWFHTDRSIHQLNTKTGEISELTEKDGFQKQNYLPADQFNYKDENGNIYFPSLEGFNQINPARYTDPPSFVYLQSLEINQKPFPLPTGVNSLTALSLSHAENKVTIETGIVDFYSRGTSHIRYKLEGAGINDDWQYAPANYIIRFENLQPGKYNLRMQASNAGNEFSGPEKALVFQVNPAYWNTWWFRSIIIMCLIGVFYSLVRWRLQQKFRMQLEHSENEKQLADMRHKTSELEMKALRAQMNPHFIFNSLNSINRFILQNNRLQASEFLTKFSRLVRLILQNSQDTLISFESELESLELYLALEALRFDYHFRFKILVPPDLDISALKVPPLIIQPYVENAIWHGLMHKEDQGQLDIELSQEEKQLFVKITDNGIGRKRAVALTSKSATRHKSMGLRITADRIANLQSSNHFESTVTINDLVNADGSAAGTEVIIKLPVIYD
jgi:Histidine kinase/Y_Y_Y domain